MLIICLIILLSLLLLLVGVVVKLKWLFYLGLMSSIFACSFAIYKLFFEKKTILEFNFTDDDRYTMDRPEMFCGDSELLPEGYDYMGSRNQCLKRGVGIGMSLPDSEIERIQYEPPRPRPRERSYCGDNDVLPADYARFASRYECMKKGVGIGARMPAEKRVRFKTGPPKRISKKELMNLASRFKINADILTRRDASTQIARAIRDLV